MQVVETTTKFTAATYLDAYGAAHGQGVDRI